MTTWTRSLSCIRAGLSSLPMADRTCYKTFAAAFWTGNRCCFICHLLPPFILNYKADSVTEQRLGDLVTIMPDQEATRSAALKSPISRVTRHSHQSGQNMFVFPVQVLRCLLINIRTSKCHFYPGLGFRCLCFRVVQLALERCFVPALFSRCPDYFPFISQSRRNHAPARPATRMISLRMFERP